MTVREALKMLDYGTEWKLVGGRSGRKLCDSFSKDKTKEKYMDLIVSDTPFTTDVRIGKTCGFADYVTPIIAIWVSGE